VRSFVSQIVEILTAPTAVSTAESASTNGFQEFRVVPRLGTARALDPIRKGATPPWKPSSSSLYCSSCSGAAAITGGAGAGRDRDGLVESSCNFGFRRGELGGEMSNALVPCKLCGTLPHGAHMRIWCPNAACSLCNVVLSESRWQTLHGPPPQACQKCTSGASTMRHLCDECFSAGVASERANPSRV
jgi:hypothetical protein